MKIKQLSETSIFQFADEDKGMNLTQNIKTLIRHPETVQLTAENLEDVFYKIRHKAFNHPAKFAVIDLFNKGIITLIYNDKLKLTTAIPYFRKKIDEHKYGVVINISNFANLDADNNVTRLDVGVLYTLMCTAVFSLEIDLRINSVLSGVPELYGSMFSSVVSRLDNMDKIAKAKIHYLATKFFYMQCGVDELRASDAASRCCKDLNKELLIGVDKEFPIDSFDNLQNFISVLGDKFDKLKNLKYGLFFDRWLRSYGEPTGFALEYVPYFYTLVMALTMNCNELVTIVTVEREATRQDEKKLIQIVDRIESAAIEMGRR